MAVAMDYRPRIVDAIKTILHLGRYDAADFGDDLRGVNLAGLLASDGRGMELARLKGLYDFVAMHLASPQFSDQPDLSEEDVLDAFDAWAAPVLVKQAESSSGGMR